MIRNQNPFASLFNENELKANREYKSSLFAFLLMHDKQNALSLCNALAGKNYTNADDIHYEMLENALYVRIHNDVAFVFDKTINLYEHQSTYNPNMPLRGFFYFSDLYKRLVNKHKLFKSKLLKIPTPRYYVFYNGIDRKNIPDRQYLKLSDAFDNRDDITGFEWTATMINIGFGHNKELMDQCKVISDYSYFVSTVRELSCDMELKDAILEAINICIKNNVLTEVLTKYRKEICYMSWTEFDEEEYEKSIKEDYEEEIAEMKAVLTEKDNTIAEMDNTIAKMDSTIAKMDSTIAKMDSTIAEMASEIARLKAKCGEA